MKNAARKIDKIAKVCLVGLALGGCALPRDLPPWERFPKTHTPLMLGSSEIVTADADADDPAPTSNPNWP